MSRRKSASELRASGSANASRRKADVRRIAERAGLIVKPKAQVPPRPPLPATDAEWSALIRCLPGYDPYLLGKGCHFDAGLAARAIDWIETHVVHLKGPKALQPFVLERWQRAFVANLFGWVRDADGLRRFREFMLYVGKKNGKSLIVSAIALYMFLEDGEAGAEVFCAAAKRDQARKVWDVCRLELARMDPDEERATRYQHSIAKADGGFLQPISADADTEDGMNPHAALLDELHRQPDDRLFNVLRLSTAARAQPIFGALTTADEDRESICNATLSRARAVRDNPGDPMRPGYDPKFLPAIYEALPTDDPARVETWRKANPNLGVSITEEFLRDQCRTAQENPAMLADFKRYHLNVVAKAAQKWIDMQTWDLCGEPFDPASLSGKECIVGVDLSSTTDITAMLAVFPETLHVVPWFWVPEDAAKKRDLRNDRIYATWGAAGLIRLTQGDQLDESRVLDEMLEVLKPYKVSEVAIDPYNSLRYTQPLMERGFPVVHVRQGWQTMSEPLKWLGILVGNVRTPGRPRIRHGGNPVLRWMAGNAMIEKDKKDNWTLVKPRGGDKIDGISALATALARIAAKPAAPRAVAPAFGWA